jgi:hypothetical protein
MLQYQDKSVQLTPKKKDTGKQQQPAGLPEKKHYIQIGSLHFLG